METWKHGDMETWRRGHRDMDMEPWGHQTENGNPRDHSFGQFKKHALLKARTQSPCFSYPGPARAFKSTGSADLLSVGGSVLPGRRDYYSGCQLLIERKCGWFICKFLLSQTSQRFLSEVKNVEFYV
jgi:hypothetical protein